MCFVEKFYVDVYTCYSLRQLTGQGRTMNENDAKKKTNILRQRIFVAEVLSNVGLPQHDMSGWF